MKIKHLLIGMLAIAGAVACKQDEPVAEPVLEVNKTNVAVAATAGESAFEVTANNAWSAAADAEWVSLDPANGTGGDKAVTVKVTAEDNTAAEVRTATVTVKSGELTKTLKVTQAAAEAEEPGPGEEPTPEGVAWGMMGCFVDNLWASDVPMAKEGEWIVAKGAQFTELTFKIRGNQSWADETNIGVAPGSERGVVNGKVSVVTAEYAKANLGGDAADIKLNGDAGTYDVYFSVENMEVYVMEQGYKPGEKEPQNPEPVEITYTVVGTIDGYAWSNNAAVGLMAVEGNYYVVKNVPFVWNSTLYGGDYNRIEFKIVETGTWSGYAYPEQNVDQYANAEFTVGHGGENIAVDAPVGNYDVYFDKANLKVWVMEAGYKPGEKEPLVPQPEPEYELDGKQWYYSNMGVLIDLGLYEEEVMVVAVPLMDGSGFGAYMYGPYEIEKTDATSGKIIFTQYDPEWDEFMDPVEYPYSELSESVVMIGAEPLTGDPTPLPFVALDEPFEIQFEEIGGADPVGPIENGQYWFFNGTKVMAPLAEGVTTGVLPAGNVIDGASTEKNIFTLMYDPDWSYYTIMDSYGRFLGQTDETGNITVTDVLPTDDTYAFYLWCVEPGYGEATSIYNAAYYYDITYSATDNNWVLVDGGYEYPETLPTLVKAENPVEEPVEPAGPKVVTVAEFNAATDNTVEYQVSGTISGIYQAYNASYDNISLYISDETGEMLAYRVSCAGINDPANTLTKGDLITVRGMRTLYNENPQMAQGGVIVEHTDVVVEQPAGSAELSFADKANRTVFTTSQQVWEQNGIKLINDKGASTSNVADYAAPARFYKSSKLTVEYAGMTKIEFVCNNGSYATALQSSITTGTVTVNGSVVTVVLPAAADSYVVESLTGGQVRMDSLTVYAE